MAARTLSPEEVALSEARKVRRLGREAKERTITETASPKHTIKYRPWLSISSQSIHAKNSRLQRVKVLTWNMLAQCLVRRELFPTSNCLKAGQREGMLHLEVLSQDADILCLQEVDRLDKLIPKLEEAGYTHKFASGPGKKHGCLIAFKTNLYKLNDFDVVYYDDQHVRIDGSGNFHCANSFRTRNIGLLASIGCVNNDSQGVIVATTHLFWHPKYTYERARQAGILVREVLRFRARLQSDNWPCILAGDFNCPPSDATYSLIVGDPFLVDQQTLINSSRVVHVSVDPSVCATVLAPSVDEGGGEEAEDPDCTITNARPAKLSDGLLSIQELVDLHNRNCRILSAYDEGLRGLKRHFSLDTFGDEATWSTGRHGCHEPQYTSYTHYWKTVLDYIFVIDPADRVSRVIGLLSPHKTADLLPGLPQRDVCASDHISLVAEMVWVDKP
ncbi:Endonuclease/exonuclease/phosphatase [Cyathus striatus]|nr:Endonuclease/exonuclease/phosphatase [Cyathus striatus]